MSHKPVRVFLVRKKALFVAGALLAAAAVFCAVNLPAAITTAAAALGGGEKILRHLLRRGVGCGKSAAGKHISRRTLIK